MRRKRYARSPDALHEIALSYLDRFATTQQRMRQYLIRKIRDAIKDDVICDEDSYGWADAEVERLVRAGLLDDDRYAEQRAGAMNRRGKSRRAIGFDLRRRGITTEQFKAAMDGLEEEQSNPELAAACNYARRRRLGPYYAGEDRRERRQKHLGALARQGFSFDIARQVIDADSVDELTELLEE